MHATHGVGACTRLATTRIGRHDKPDRATSDPSPGPTALQVDGADSCPPYPFRLFYCDFRHSASTLLASPRPPPRALGVPHVDPIMWVIGGLVHFGYTPNPSSASSPFSLATSARCAGFCPSRSGPRSRSGPSAVGVRLKSLAPAPPCSAMVIRHAPRLEMDRVVGRPCECDPHVRARTPAARHCDEPFLRTLCNVWTATTASTPGRGLPFLCGRRRICCSSSSCLRSRAHFLAGLSATFSTGWSFAARSWDKGGL